MCQLRNFESQDRSRYNLCGVILFRSCHYLELEEDKSISEPRSIINLYAEQIAKS